MKLAEIRNLLPANTPLNDVLLLLSKNSGLSKAQLLTADEILLDLSSSLAFQSDLTQYLSGTPLPYLLGEWEFFGEMFFVSPAVLIPRPETEMLIEEALKWANAHPMERVRIVDVGTGSGIIAITLAKRLRNAQVLAIDISEEALAIARKNAARQAVEASVQFLLGDLLDALPGDFTPDILCANLPYIPSETLTELEVFGKEPTLALDGGPDGLDLIRRSIQQTVTKIPKVKCCLFEIEDRQGKAVKLLAEVAFSKAQVEILQDLAGHDRFVRILNSTN